MDFLSGKDGAPHHDETAAENGALGLAQTADPKAKELIGQQIAGWRKNAERYDSEPETNEGRKELAARAKATEHKRDRALAAYHNYEIASARCKSRSCSRRLRSSPGSRCSCGSPARSRRRIAFSLIGFFWPTSVHLSESRTGRRARRAVSDISICSKTQPSAKREAMSEQRLSERSARLGITQPEIDQRVFDLYDEYCHGRIDRANS